MKILGNTKSKTQKMKMVKMFLVVLIHCNIVNNNYQQNSRVLYTFVPSKSFGQLLVISPKNFIFFKNFWFRIFYIKVWVTDQNSKPLEIKDKTNITLVIH